MMQQDSEILKLIHFICNNAYTEIQYEEYIKTFQGKEFIINAMVFQIRKGEIILRVPGIHSEGELQEFMNLNLSFSDEYFNGLLKLNKNEEITILAKLSYKDKWSIGGQLLKVIAK